MGPALLVAFASFHAPAAGPPLDLDQQVASSDVIVVGTVTFVQKGETTHIELAGRNLPGTVYEAEVRVDRMLKGTHVPATLVVRFAIESNPAGGSGRFNGVTASSYRMLFLKHAGRFLEFTEPGFPSLPAAPGPSLVDSPDVAGAVLQELSQALDFPKATDSDRLEVIQRLQSSFLPGAADILSRHLTASNPSVRAAAASALLQRSDLTALEVGRDLLMNPPPGTPDYLIGNISSAIGRSIKDERAIPVLRALLAGPDVRGRRAAAFALRNTGSPHAVPALGLALDDSDSEVRYYAVIGLAELTGQNEWRPLMEQFKAHESHYLGYWRQWARDNAH